MEILQLKYFCDAARTENFSKTAKKHLVPTSDISQSIKRLERELGCSLFNRTANRISLNERGRRFYEQINEALLLIESAKLGVSEDDGEIVGDIKIVCLCNRRTVTEAIENFIKKHPRVNFVIHHGLSDTDDYDLLISDVCPYEYEKKQLLINEDICVAMRGDDPLANNKGFSVSELEDRRLITMTSGSSLYRITTNACYEAGFTANIAIQTDDPLYLRKYVEMGLGVAFVPMSSWKGLFGGGVALKSIDGLKRRTYAYLSKSGASKRATVDFLDFLTEEARQDTQSLTSINGVTI